MKSAKQHICFAIDSLLHSYTQIFFSKNKLLGVLLLATTFFDVGMGLTGVTAVVISNGLAFLLGFEKQFIKEGSYGFNGLLVGLGLGLYYQPGPAFVALLVVAMLITFLVTVAVSGVLSRYGLPYLSIPFLIAIWSILLAARGFEAMGLSEKGVYLLNELYAGGNLWLVQVYQWFDTSNIPEPVHIYLTSLGAILFQFNALAGVVIAVGLLLHSRISFSLSILSFLVAYYFYVFIGADINSLGYSYIGFNFILSGIALGSFFLIPSKSTYAWSFALIPAMVVLTAAVSQVFSMVQLGVYSLPFNLIVIMFLYMLNLRTRTNAKPERVRVQLYSPEKNLYERLSNTKRYTHFKWQAIGVPFFGEWLVSQGHSGQYTHKGEWQHAWDFVVVDEKLKQYRNKGDYREDYYCFGKPVLAPADGTIETILAGVEDNLIGDTNLYQNWGNTIVIKHGYQLYTQVSHLKEGSIKVKQGEIVKRGDVIAQVGNSGRSPYPHLHFQVQKTPYIGSKTLDYPLNNYLVKNSEGLSFNFFNYPKENAIIKNIETNNLMTSAFHFVPGKRFKFEVMQGNSSTMVHWEIQSDVYNNQFIYCHISGAKAYFVNDGTLHYFTLFKGRKDSLLYYFFMATYEVLLTFHKPLTLQTWYPLYLVAPYYVRFLHDFIAPFFQYLRARFELHYLSIDDELAPTEITIASRAIMQLFTKTRKQIKFNLTIKRTGITRFEVVDGNKKIIAKCVF